MKRFLEMVQSIYEKNYVQVLTQIHAQRKKCAVLAGEEAVASFRQRIAGLQQQGFQITKVLCPEGRDIQDLQNSLNVAVAPLQKLPQMAGSIDVALLPFQGIYASLFPYFSRYGVPTICLAGTAYMQNALNQVMEHLQEIYDTYQMLSTEASRNVFCQYVLGRMSLQQEEYRYADEPQYFLKDFLPEEGDIAIDGGAFDGMTAREFKLLGANVHAFELAAENMEKCQKVAEQYGFTLVNKGLGDTKKVLHYGYSGAGTSTYIPGDESAEIIDIDTYASEQGLSHIDYIKLDIECAELEALHGAANTIARCKPKLAISCYHRLEDLWTLAPYLHALRPDYQMEFRHYRIDQRNSEGNEKSILQAYQLPPQMATSYEAVLYCR